MLRQMMTVASGVAALCLVGAPAGASQWEPYQSEDFSYAAGDVCEFPVQVTVLADKERFRTTETYPDGSPELQQFTGQLIIRYTNESTGAYVDRNLTGRGDFRYFPDGSSSLTDQGGSFAAGLHQGDDPGPGIFVVSGKGWVVTIDADGHKTLTAGQGTVENVCDTLA